MQQAHLYPNTLKLYNALVRIWPEHQPFLDKSFKDRDVSLAQSTEQRAEDVLRIIGSDDKLDKYCVDYRFLCEKVLEEELFFRRNSRYRLSSFDEAVTHVYSNTEFMDRYMNFLLITIIVWRNHASAIAHFENCYLPKLRPGSHHLEIGPGHGLLLSLAAKEPAVTSVTAWDVSATSLSQTQRCLSTLGIEKQVDLVLRDLLRETVEEGNGRKFQSVVLSEVLEHLEDPVAALQALRSHMAPGARIWIQVPVNSPAPDHIYLLRTPEASLDLTKAGGFEILEHAFFPMTGVTLEQARKRELTISSVIIAENPECA